MTEQPLTIRAYQDKDQSDLIALYQLAFPHDPPWNDPADMIASKRMIDQDGLLAGLFDGKVIASVMAGYDGHRGWINCLAVHPHHRGQDLGKAMIDAAIDLMTARGAVKVNLQIRGDNTSLQRYYESLGFETEDRISMGLLTSRGKAFQDQ